MESTLYNANNVIFVINNISQAITLFKKLPVKIFKLDEDTDNIK